MSEQQEDKQAWAWYEIDTLSLQHVGFNPKMDYGPNMDKIAMHYDTALAIVSGQSRLFEYELINKDNQLVIIYKKQQRPFKKFWQLIDPSKSVFNSQFGPATGAHSPVIIKDRDNDGFTIDIGQRATNIVLYITMKNDPNYLIKKIDVYTHAVDLASTTDIKIPVDIEGDYSIYVRYDAT